MPVVIQMPKLGHAMTEGTVLQWHKRAGETVTRGELVLTVETDKAEVEVEAPAAGVLARLSAAQGEVVQVGGELAVIAIDGETLPAATAPPPSTPRPTVAAPAPQASAAAAPGRGARVIASPRAKRIAAEAGVDLGTLSGSGPDGMI